MTALSRFDEREAKVSNLGNQSKLFVSEEKDVLRFDVRVNDAALMQSAQSIGDVKAQPQPLSLGDDIVVNGFCQCPWRGSKH
jgi:hypothetical protein